MANQDAAQVHERLVNVIAPLVADTQTTLLMHPADRSLDDPPKDAETTAMFRVPASQHGLDAALTQLLSMGLR
ncbi:unnamed protein product, partial [marine sediment metagenome]